MRRTFNNLIRQAAGEIAARAMTGHVTTEMTEHYSDVTVDERRKAQEAAFGELAASGETTALGGTSGWNQGSSGGTKPEQLH